MRQGESEDKEYAFIAENSELGLDTNKLSEIDVNF